jgi:hypothetical protein
MQLRDNDGKIIEEEKLLAGGEMSDTDQVQVARYVIVVQLTSMSFSIVV